MKKELLKMSFYVSLSLFASRTYAEEAGCDCYMEYQNLEAEAAVYFDEQSKNESLTEFSQEVKDQIKEATTIIAEG